jgi:hypothetical protein
LLCAFGVLFSAVSSLLLDRLRGSSSSSSQRTQIRCFDCAGSAKQCLSCQQQQQQR